MATTNEFGQSATAPGDAPVWQPEVPEAQPAAGGTEAAGIEPGAASAPVRSAPTRPGRVKRASSTSILLVLSALIALGGVGFAVGRATGGSSTGDTNAAALNNGFPGGGAGASGRPDLAGGPNGLTSTASTVSGTVLSSTADSITIQLADGQQVTLSTGSSTTYHSQTAASGSAVAVGASVIVKTSAGASTGAIASAAASAGTGAGTTRTATDITITGN